MGFLFGNMIDHKGEYSAHVYLLYTIPRYKKAHSFEWAFFIFIGRRGVGEIGHNVPNIAIEDPAKDFHRVGADAFVPLQPGELTGADAVLLNQGVLGYAFLLHDYPKIIKRNQADPSFFHLTS